MIVKFVFMWAGTGRASGASTILCSCSVMS